MLRCGVESRSRSRGEGTRPILGGLSEVAELFGIRQCPTVPRNTKIGHASRVPLARRRGWALAHRSHVPRTSNSALAASRRG
jgi:hypothetical protein